MNATSAAADLLIRGVNVSYGANHVLKDVNLKIRPGEFFAFLGPSGCGKTTLLRLIAGFAQAQTGAVLIGGQDVAQLPPWKRDVGLVFQSYALWPHMSVRLGDVEIVVDAPFESASAIFEQNDRADLLLPARGLNFLSN